MGVELNTKTRLDSYFIRSFPPILTLLMKNIHPFFIALLFLVIGFSIYVSKSVAQTCNGVNIINGTINGAYSGDHFITGALVSGVRTVTVTANSTLSNGTFFIDEDVRIVISSGVSLGIVASTVNTVLEPCPVINNGQYNWFGIRVSNGGTIYTTGNNGFRDQIFHADIGVEVMAMTSSASPFTDVRIDHCDFINNGVGIHFVGTTQNLDPAITITRNSFVFDGNLGFYAAEVLNANARTDAGIRLRHFSGANAEVEIGATGIPTEFNEFTGVDFGIHSFNTNLFVGACSFNELTANATNPTLGNGGGVGTAINIDGSGTAYNEVQIGDPSLSTGNYSNVFDDPDQHGIFVSGFGYNFAGTPSSWISITNNSFTDITSPIRFSQNQRLDIGVAGNFARDFLIALHIATSIINLDDIGIRDNLFENYSGDTWYLATASSGIRYQPVSGTPLANIFGNRIVGVHQGMWLSGMALDEFDDNYVEFGHATAADPIGIYIANSVPFTGSYFYPRDCAVECVASPTSANTSYGYYFTGNTGPWVHGCFAGDAEVGIRMDGTNSNFNLTCNTIDNSAVSGITISNYTPASDVHISRTLTSFVGNEQSDNQWTNFGAL